MAGWLKTLSGVRDSSWCSIPIIQTALCRISAKPTHLPLVRVSNAGNALAAAAGFDGYDAREAQADSTADTTASTLI